MAEVGEQFAEHEEEAFGGILETGPTGGGKEFVGRGLEVAKIGDVAAGALVGCGVEFEMNLIVAADEGDGQGRAVGAVSEAIFYSDGETEAEKRIVGGAGVEPVGGQVEFGAHSVGGFENRGREGFGLHEAAVLKSGENVHLACGGAANEVEGEEGRTAAHDKMARAEGALGEQLSEQSESLV
jgi:hypothetical protein